MRNNQVRDRAALLIMLMLTLTMFSVNLRADQGNCGGQLVTVPFTDVMGNQFYCQIAAAYFSGLTNGTTLTTYSPGNSVPREQMAAFVTRTLDQSLKRGNQRAALGQWWTNKSNFSENVGSSAQNPRFLASDGRNLWVSYTDSHTVARIDIGSSNVTCAKNIVSPEQIVIVGGMAMVASYQSPGKIVLAGSPQNCNGAELELATGPNPVGITFDGQNLWTANDGGGLGSGSISRVPLNGVVHSTFITGFSQPRGILYDGANLWVTDVGDATLKRVDLNTGAVLQTTALSGSVQHPIFDGTNLWIPCTGFPQVGLPDKVFVVRGGLGGVLTGTVLAELTGNGLNSAFQAAFDGERIAVTNVNSASISLWRATDLSPITYVIRDNVYGSRGICSDGTIFFVGLRPLQGAGASLISRF